MGVHRAMPHPVPHCSAGQPGADLLSSHTNGNAWVSQFTSLNLLLQLTCPAATQFSTPPSLSGWAGNVVVSQKPPFAGYATLLSSHSLGPCT